MMSRWIGYLGNIPIRYTFQLINSNNRRRQGRRYHQQGN